MYYFGFSEGCGREFRARIERSGFFTTEKANSNILGAILLDQTSYNWRDTSGNLVILNVADLKNLAALIAAQRGAVYNNEACKIIEVHNATTIEEVESITWQ